MDIISFNESSTANGRIESFIKNPDSTSGIITVPKVIASGETITIPAGRVAVLPNVQVDGVLDIQGDVFIPAGSSISQTVSNAYNYTLGGTTLSTWSSLSVMEGAGGTFFGSNGISALTGSNAMYNGTWKYKVDGSAGLQLVNQGSHQFRVGAAGLAGGNITWDTVANVDSTGMNVKAGSAAVPGYGFLGDTDTGIWNPAANTLAISVGGTEKVRVDSTGLTVDGVGMLGHGQTWQDMTASRVAGTTYTNTTGKPICVLPSAQASYYNNYVRFDFYINGTKVLLNASNEGVTFATISGQFIIPNLATYRLDVNTGVLYTWFELR